MKFEHLFTLQRQLDTRIVKEHNLEHEDLFENKLLALKVEIGELANETRCFKYWSKKAPSPKETILEEYVDGIHFILSLGIELGITTYEAVSKGDLAGSEVHAFHRVYKAIDQVASKKNEEAFNDLMESYLLLGQLIGLRFEEMNEAYLKKNKVNHNRQDQGY
ncbi:dUTP diphosphatase [Guptibacillus hwajinpoensis]|uniref:dUTP diphosphatase n=1 Tax=Guptibacillus hwajinpoensis TaxID=208199 RepID=UPI001CFE04D5|nr:dUTP diphosphatase [Pseudalkalibacillus hwajinpoensis]WLR60780.1 dUTP diphosphatase [Pseudalkalibacillus hwajinpoensis]